MNNKMRSMLKVIAVLLVLLAVLMELHVVSIPSLLRAKFWMVVVAFGLMLITTK
jgi:hypothetical protein